MVERGGTLTGLELDPGARGQCVAQRPRVTARPSGVERGRGQLGEVGISDPSTDVRRLGQGERVLPGIRLCRGKLRGPVRLAMRMQRIFPLDAAV